MSPSPTIRSHLSRPARKRISTDQLKSGMYLVGIYQSWWNSPFFRHHRLLTRKDIELLRHSGIAEVMIDPTRSRLEETDEIEANEREICSEQQSKGMAGSPISSHGDAEGTKGEGREEEEWTSPWEAADQVRSDAVKAVREMFEGVKTGVAIDQPVLETTVEALVEEVVGQGEALAEAVLLQSLRQFEKILYDHVVDVAVLSLMVGVRLGLEPEELRNLAIGALLHDVGYMRLPRNLLRRKHHLIGDEQTLFERHPELGGLILDAGPTLHLEARRIVVEHHERRDGSGYPNGLKASGLSGLSEIVGVVDRFDGMISAWGTPSPLPSAMAIRCLYQEGQTGKLNPKPIESLISTLGVFPIGSLVLLESREQAIVLKANPKDRLKPIVKIITDPDRQPYAVPLVVDLSVSDAQAHARGISSVLDPNRHRINVLKYFEVGRGTG